MGSEFDHQRKPAQTSEQQHVAPPEIEQPQHESPAAVPAPVRGIAAPHDPLGGTEVGGDTAAALSRPEPGKALPTPLRRSMERELGADFSGVRIHDDAHAGGLARSVGASAFTHGSHVYFGNGGYQPDTAQGRHTLAHELTHVAQRQQGRDRGMPGAVTPTIGRADDPLETEAERSAGRVVESLRRSAAGGAA